MVTLLTLGGCSKTEVAKPANEDTTTCKVRFFQASAGNSLPTEISFPGWDVTTIPIPPGYEENALLGYTLSMDSQNRIHVAYIARERLFYSCWDGKSWASPTIVDDANKKKPEEEHADLRLHGMRLALDKKDHPHIAYICSEFQMPWADEPGEVLYAYWDGSEWRHEKVESREVNVDNLSLALDAGGNPYLTYIWVAGHSEYGGSVSALIYAHRVNGKWKTVTVDDKTVGSEYQQRSAIALDVQGHPYIVYSSGEPLLRPLSYASWDGKAWRSEIVDPAAQVKEIAFAIDKAGLPHIAYYDECGYDLKYAEQGEQGWHLSTIDSADKVGINISMMLDAQDNACISYGRETVSPYSEAEPVLQSVVLAHQSPGGWQYAESPPSGLGKQPGMIRNVEGKPQAVCFTEDYWYLLIPKEGSWQSVSKAQPAATLDYSGKLVHVTLPSEAWTLVDAKAPWQVLFPAAKSRYESWREITLWNAPSSWADISDLDMIGELKHGVPYEVVDGRAIWTNMSDVSNKHGYDLCLLLRQGDLEGWISTFDMGNPASYKIVNEQDSDELSLPAVLVYFSQPYSSLRTGPGNQYGIIRAPHRETGEPSLGPKVPAGTCYEVKARVDGWLAAGTWSNAWFPLATPGLEPFFLAFVLSYKDSREYIKDYTTPVCISFYLPAKGKMTYILYRVKCMYNITRPFADPVVKVSYYDGNTAILVPQFLGGSYMFSSYVGYFDAALPASAPHNRIASVTFEAGWGADRFKATMFVGDILKGGSLH